MFQAGQRAADDLLGSVYDPLHRFVDPFPVSKVICPSFCSVRVHPTFHVSRVKPVKETPWFLLPIPPRRSIVAQSTPLRNLLLCARGVGAGNSRWTGKVMVLRNVPGSPQASLWTLTSSLTFTAITLRCLVHQELTYREGYRHGQKSWLCLRCLV